MLQKPSGEFIVQDVRGSEVFTAKGASFTDFCEKNKEYCEDKLFPLFSHLGIRFTKDIYKAPPVPKKSVEEKSKVEKNGGQKPSKAKSTTERATIEKAAIKKISVIEAKPQIKAQIALPRKK